MKKTFVAGALAFTMAAGENLESSVRNVSFWRLPEIIVGWKRFSREVTLKLLPNLISHQMNLLILPRVVMSSMWEVILRWRNTSQINLVWS